MIAFMLLLANMIYISLSAWFVLVGHNYVLDTGSFLKDTVIAVGIIFVFYLLFWLVVATKSRKSNSYSITSKDIWIAMTPNIIVTIFLFINGAVTHLGFISFMLGSMVLTSVIFIPLFGVAAYASSEINKMNGL